MQTLLASKMKELQKYSHKRYNILTGEWVLVSPHRAKRPWQGQKETVLKEKRHMHDDSCYLCAGNIRANGQKNPEYKDVYVFENDFAALQKESKDFTYNKGLLKAEAEQGICKVICFSPDHSKSLAQMTTIEITKVVKAWKREYKILKKEENIKYVQIFENKGAVMGCSNPHPHGQIWSQSTIPNEVEKKEVRCKEYFNRYQKTILKDYIKEEQKNEERILYQNEHFVLLIPFWAVWPFETMIIPIKAQNSIEEMNIEEEIAFAETIAVITKAYDKIFDCSFPYSSGIHQAPTNNNRNDHWHWHMSFYPPLLRSETVKKFMVGYEMFGSPQRDITPELAAKTIKRAIEK